MNFALLIKVQPRMNLANVFIRKSKHRDTIVCKRENNFTVILFFEVWQLIKHEYN